MEIIKIEPFENGGRPSIQTWDTPTTPGGYALVPNTIDTTLFYEHNGFVNIIVENGVVVEMTPNLDALEAWKASLPPEPTPEPTPEERIASLEVTIDLLTLAILEG